MDFFRSRYLIGGAGAWPASGGAVPDGHVFTVAPSDLTFLLHECPRCFWLKVAGGHRRPQSPMPGVFTRLDRIQRSFFDGRRTSEVHRSLPAGRLDCGDLKVCSAPLALDGARARLRIRGAIDALIEFDDGAFGIVDFKTSSPGESSKTNYSCNSTPTPPPSNSTTGCTAAACVGPPRRLAGHGIQTARHSPSWH